MSDIIESKNTPKKESGISVQTILIGLAVAGFAALIIYQMIGCATCY